MATSPYSGDRGNISHPPRNAYAVTPDNSNQLPTVTRALWIGTAGDVKVDMEGSGTGIIFKNVSGLLPGFFSKVYLTGTSAADIVAVH